MSQDRDRDLLRACADMQSTLLYRQKCFAACRQIDPEDWRDAIMNVIHAPPAKTWEGLQARVEVAHQVFMTSVDEEKPEVAIVLGLLRDLLQMDRPPLSTSASVIKFPGRTP